MRSLFYRFGRGNETQYQTVTEVNNDVLGILNSTLLEKDACISYKKRYFCFFVGRIMMLTTFFLSKVQLSVINNNLIHEVLGKLATLLT